jgi:predicted RNA-binding protein with PUA-like domain
LKKGESIMARWLFKQEPDCYSYSQLEADQRTTWDGISNALALKHLRNVQVGDEVFFYHTGDEKAIVGIMQICSTPQVDPENEKSVIVDVKPVQKLAKPVTLATIKSDDFFSQWELVKQSRLSVMPVSDAMWQRLLKLAEPEAEPTQAMGKRK